MRRAFALALGLGLLAAGLLEMQEAAAGITYNPGRGSSAAGASSSTGALGAPAGRKPYLYWCVAANSSTAMSQCGGGIAVGSSFTASGSANTTAHKYASFATSASLGNVAFYADSFGTTAWGFAPKVYGLVRTDSAITSRQFAVGLGQNTTQLGICGVPVPGAAQTACAQSYMQLMFDTSVSANWVLAASDGTNQKGVDTGVAVVANTDYLFSLDYNVTTAGAVKATLNGTPSSSSLTTNVGAAATAMGFVMMVRTATAAIVTQKTSWAVVEEQ
jgi:hypothetical protein